MTRRSVFRLREEAKRLHWLGDRINSEAEELFERAAKLKAEARDMDERADELDELDKLAPFLGDHVTVRREA